MKAVRNPKRAKIPNLVSPNHTINHRLVIVFFEMIDSISASVLLVFFTVRQSSHSASAIPHHCGHAMDYRGYKAYKALMCGDEMQLDSATFSANLYG